MKVASADLGLMALAYNLTRLINTGIGLKELLQKAIIGTKTLFLVYIKPQNPMQAIWKIKNLITLNFGLKPDYNYFNS